MNAPLPPPPPPLPNRWRAPGHRRRAQPGLSRGLPKEKEEEPGPGFEGRCPGGPGPHRPPPRPVLPRSPPGLPRLGVRWRGGLPAQALCRRVGREQQRHQVSARLWARGGCVARGGAERVGCGGGGERAGAPELQPRRASGEQAGCGRGWSDSRCKGRAAGMRAWSGAVGIRGRQSDGWACQAGWGRARRQGGELESLPGETPHLELGADG